MNDRKKNTSVRLNKRDLERLHGVARRLQVNESDLLRFCIRQTLNKLTPLDEPGYRGADLVPALLEVGEDLTRYFEFDSQQLCEIVNGKGDNGTASMCESDVNLFALSVWNANSVLNRIISLAGGSRVDGGMAPQFLRSYLFDKYVPVDRRRTPD